MVEAERRLWRAVLDQALVDAEQPDFAPDCAPDCVPGCANDCAPNWALSCPTDDCEPLWRVQARRLLRGDSPLEKALLKLVCEFADRPADRVMKWARKRYPVREIEQHASPPYDECAPPRRQQIDRRTIN
jgi:hypothetical protein